MEPTTRHADCVTDVQRLRGVTLAAAALFTYDTYRPRAVDYLTTRGIDAEDLPRTWLIGYAPPRWSWLVDRLRPAFDEQTLLDAGLAHRSSRGTLIDTFRDRAVIGIRDHDGTIAGFTGRDLSGHAAAPKYLNTRQHPLFDKSRLLFGLHEGTSQSGPRQPVIVEGPLDVLAIVAWQHHHGDAGLLPLAACGTAFTQAHANAIAELAHDAPVTLALDNDAAGKAATLRAGERLRAVGVDVRVAQLPNDTDPAGYLADGRATVDIFRADHSRPLLTAHVQQAIAAQGDRIQWIEGRLAALRRIAEHLATYPPGYTARHVGWIAERVGLAPQTVTCELAGAYEDAARRGRPSPPAKSDRRAPTPTI